MGDHADAGTRPLICCRYGCLPSSRAAYPVAAANGELAAKLRPQVGSRYEHLDYDYQLAGLVAEFNPVTMSEWNLVEMLASDYLQLAKIKVQQAALMTTGAVGAAMPYFEHPADRDHMLALLDFVVTQMEQETPFTCTPEQLEDLVPMVTRRVHGLISKATSKDDDELPGGEDVEEIKQARRINPARLKATDAKTVTAVLSGEELSPVVRQGWTELLRLIQRIELKGCWSNEQQCERIKKKLWAERPSVDQTHLLALYQRYETSCWKMIERRVVMLKALRN